MRKEFAEMLFQEMETNKISNHFNKMITDMFMKIDHKIVKEIINKIKL